MEALRPVEHPAFVEDFEAEAVEGCPRFLIKGPDVQFDAAEAACVRLDDERRDELTSNTKAAMGWMDGDMADVTDSMRRPEPGLRPVVELGVEIACRLVRLGEQPQRGGVFDHFPERGDGFFVRSVPTKESGMCGCVQGLNVVVEGHECLKIERRGGADVHCGFGLNRLPWYAR